MNESWTHVLWTDLLGHPHVARVRTSALAAGRMVRIPRASGIGSFEVTTIDTDGTSSLLLAPDPSTERPIPWQPGVRLVIADLREPDGSPSAMCSRTALRRVLDLLAVDGLSVSCAAELEFYLLDPVTGTPVYADIENYSMVRGAEYEPLLSEIRNRLREMDLIIEASNPEYSGGQFEVNIVHGPALASADRAILLREAVRALAARAGRRATFMAKPWTDQSGSGMHVHQSLWREGSNVFHQAPDALSQAGRHYVAGLLRRMGEFALLGSPTPNAYHRRNDHSFCPTAICWGADNRTLAVRAIVGSPASTRVEQRDAAAEANPYLAFAGQFWAGLEGMRDGLEPPPMTTGDAYTTPKLERLPRSFIDAYARLAGSGAARAALGDATVHAYLRALEPEREMMLASSTDWERARYLQAV